MSNFVDLADNGSPPTVSQASTTRLARVAGLLQGSSDGAPFQPLGIFGAQFEEARRAAAALGRSDLLSFFHLPSAQGPLPFNSVGGSGSLPWVSGALRLSTGTTAASFARLLMYSDGGGNFGRFLRAGVDWYISARFAVTTAVTAQTTAFAGGETNAGAFALAMGVIGSVDFTTFRLKGSTGSPVLSGVNIDTNFHTHRGWRTGGLTYYQVDNNPIITGSADIAADVMPYVFVGNGTDVVDRSMSLVWWSASAPSL